MSFCVLISVSISFITLNDLKVAIIDNKANL